MNIQHVPVEFVQQVWPRVEPFVIRAIDAQHGRKDYTLDQVRLMVATGQWMLLVAVDEEKVFHGAAVIDFQNRPNDRVAFIVYIGGKGIATQPAFEQMRAQVKAFGATTIEGAVTPAVARLWQRFDFSEKYKIVERRL